MSLRKAISLLYFLVIGVSACRNKEEASIAKSPAFSGLSFDLDGSKNISLQPLPQTEFNDQNIILGKAYFVASRRYDTIALIAAHLTPTNDTMLLKLSTPMIPGAVGKYNLFTLSLNDNLFDCMYVNLGQYRTVLLSPPSTFLPWSTSGSMTISSYNPLTRTLEGDFTFTQQFSGFYSITLLNGKFKNLPLYEQ